MSTQISPLQRSKRTIPLLEFQPDELFFSITNDRGIIQNANSVFVKLSGFSFEQLIGQPHNIIRDSAMPRGAFRLIWNELEAGRPVASYVANHTSDEKNRYEVFAVMVPVERGFLSIRLKPEATGLSDRVFEIFDRAREVESGIKSTARDQASAGADFILGEFQKLGIPDMAAFARLTIPNEVEANLQYLPELEGGDGLQEELQLLPGKVRLMGRVLSSPMHALTEIREAIKNIDGTQAIQLRSKVELLAEKFGIFALENQMVGRFATELLNGSVVEPPGESMRMLHHALEVALAGLLGGVTEVKKLVETTPALASALAGINLDIDEMPLRATVKFMGMVVSEID